MTDKLIVFVACESSAQAAIIAESAVSSQLAACVNIIPGVRSCYMWEGKLTWSDEVVLMMKTTQSRYGQLQERVREFHSYEIPGIVSVEIETGYEKYIDWIDKSVVRHHE